MTMTNSQLEAFSREGFDLRTRLQAWKQIEEACQTISSDETQTALAKSYYPAISIYLSGAFDYFPIWHARGIATPVLAMPEIHGHVDEIIEMASKILRSQAGAGVSLLFPLRVAGARSRFDTMDFRRIKIRELLRRIASAYAVSEAFISDLNNLWAI